MTITDQAPPVQRPTISLQYPYQTLVPTSYPIHYPYVSVPATPYLQPHQAVHNPPPRILLPSCEPVNLPLEHPLMFSSYGSSPSLAGQPIGAVDSNNISSLHGGGLPDSNQLPCEPSSNMSQQQSLSIATPSPHSGNSSSLTEDCRQQPVSGYDTLSVVSISENDQMFRKVSIVCY